MKLEKFLAVNTLLGNLKTAFAGTYHSLNSTADAVERAREGRRASLRAKSYLEAGECSPVLGDGDGFDNGFGNDGAAYAHD